MVNLKIVKMKVVKYLVVFFAFIILIVLAIVYFFTSNVEVNLKMQSKAVENQWKLFYEFTRKRNLYLKQHIKEGEKDSIYNMLLFNIKANVGEELECKDSFILKEYVLNNEILKKTSINGNSTILDIRFTDTIKSFNDTLNLYIVEYNRITSNYNRYFSTFPNFIIAKQKGFKRKKLFPIKYGILNENPENKKKILPKWAEGVDTL